MAEAMIKGLTSSGIIAADNIYVTNARDKAKLLGMQQRYQVQPTDIQTGCRQAQVIILAVKPAAIVPVCQEIAPLLTAQHTVISVAAGVTTLMIEQALQAEIPVVRAMPNTSSAIGRSATGICAGAYATEATMDIAETIFATTGNVVVVDERQMDAVTAISGSGPAYIYYLIEGMEQAAIRLGLSADDARKLVLQTVSGAVQMVIDTAEEPAELRRKVTSPNGTTEAGLRYLEQHDFHGLLEKMASKAASRAEEMRKEIEQAYEL